MTPDLIRQLRLSSWHRLNPPSDYYTLPPTRRPAPKAPCLVPKPKRVLAALPSENVQCSTGKVQQGIKDTESQIPVVKSLLEIGHFAAQVAACLLLAALTFVFLYLFLLVS